MFLGRIQNYTCIIYKNNIFTFQNTENTEKSVPLPGSEVRARQGFQLHNCCFRFQMNNLSIVPLHNYPNYLMDCCHLINDEWKRSDTARLHSLQNSCDTLPTSLILIKDKKLIGHLKLSVIPSIKEACFVESVVIEKSLRGKGYGTILMRKAEDYCKSCLNIDTIYLSTKGQEQFYSKIGYTECPPISIYGSLATKTVSPQCKTENTNKTVMDFPPPPPPPLPINKDSAIKKTFMKKKL
ncbi:hypothetical protein NQ317_015783 [Molorchus minor]|uniref:N-acetyltransferase domain-containing protein n=1 Tax=Molorchus minor TaxID=1323400 RepID=A0ABQ9J574_9CUCU|nr:hypothetical protein NQ317_015783 [Molorchus minor]